MLIGKMELSKINKGILKVYRDGYRVIKQVIYNPAGKILKGRIDKSGYRVFKSYKVYPYLPVHKLVAYQKFGSKLFESKIQVRHLDNNSLNNAEYNIDLGTGSDNMMDQDEKVRICRSINAASKLRKFTDEEVRRVREDYKVMRSYKDVMSLWNISSKGTLHYILNNKYVTISH